MKKAIVFYKEYFTLERGEFKEFHLSRPEGKDAYIGEVEITADEGFDIDIYETIAGDTMIANGQKYAGRMSNRDMLYDFLAKKHPIEGLHYKTTKPVEKICQY